MMQKASKFTFEREKADRPHLTTDETGKAMPLNPNRHGSTERPPMPEALAGQYTGAGVRGRRAAMEDAARDLQEDDE